MYCILNTSTDPYFNLAAEEYLLKNFREEIFMLWRNDRAIIIGKYQNTAAEINADYVKENGIRVVRRQTGGGAVFHDLGNVNYTFIADKDSGDFRTFSEPVLQVLNELGVPARFEGRNDLTINGQKFSGNAQCVYRDRILHHGTLLFSSVMNDLAAALKVNPLKFKDKAVKSVRKRVTNIREHLPMQMDVSDFINIVMKHVSTRTENAKPYAFTDEDLRAIRQLKEEKYDTWEWNYGASPKFEHTKMIRTAGGNVEITLSVNKGEIENLRIYGDFFSKKELDEFEKMFIGQAYDESTIALLLSRIPLDEYLCQVTAADIIELLFH